MKKSILFSMLGMAVLFLVNSCQKQELKPDPVLELSELSVDVDAAGGPRSVAYKVTNATDDKVSAKSEAAWILDLTATATNIEFNVEENESTSPRDAKIVVSYPGAKDVELTVNQAGAALPPSLKLLQTTVDATAEGASYSIKYELANPVEGADFTFAPAKEVAWISNFAVNESESEISFDVATNYATDPRSVDVAVSYPGAGDASVFTVKQSGVAIDPDAAFAIETAINGPTVSFIVDPKDYDGYWYYGAFDASSAEGASSDELAAAATGDLLSTAQMYEMYYGITIDEFLSVYCPSGKMSIPMDTAVDTEVLFIAVQIGNDGTLGENTTAYLVTESEIHPSDNIITISTSDVTASQGTINFATTNNDAYLYMVGSFDESYTDGDIINEMLAGYSAGESVYLGAGNSSVIFNLPSASELTVYAFGYAGGEATTGITTHTFSTPELTVGEEKIDMSYKYYDLNDCIAATEDASLQEEFEYYLSNGYDAMLKVDVTTDASEYYWNYFAYSSFADAGYYQDDDILREYIYSNRTNMQTLPTAIYVAEYGDSEDLVAFLAGIAVDENGALGPVYKSEPFTLDEAGASDASELISYLTGASSLSTKSAASHAFKSAVSVESKLATGVENAAKAVNPKQVELKRL